MPPYPLQDIVVIQDLGGTASTAAVKLKERLEKYPEVRILSIALVKSGVAAGVELVAVVEGVLDKR